MIAPNEDTPAPKENKTTEPKAKPAPTVQAVDAFQPGQKVKHANGATFEVRYQTPEGVALVGVANLVHPSALKPI